MPILTAEGISKSYPTTIVLKEVTFSLELADRVGLIGPNGCGKTTLLRILAGVDEATVGRVSRRSGLRVGYLPQDPPPFNQDTLWQVMLDVFAGVRKMEEDLHKLAEKLEDPDADKSLLDRYGAMQSGFEAGGGYTYTNNIHVVLAGLGFTEAQYSQPMAQMSGGQQTRALLAMLLLQEPDLLLLDEPTNHLDLDMLEWLQDWVNAFKGCMIVVSHDRYFLDKATNRTWELHGGLLDMYVGPYSHYLTQSAERKLERQRVYEAQKNYIETTRDFIARNVAASRTGVAKGRRTRLERFLKDEAIEAPPERKDITIKLSPVTRSGDLVLDAKGLVIGYDPGKPLLRAQELQVLRGQRVAVVGPNGIGKTTLIKTLLGELKPLSGQARVGGSVVPGYLSQNHHDLDWDVTALESVRQVNPGLNDRAARSLLGCLLISGNDVFKKVGQLSGGQRSRIVLARLSAIGANLLVLDEPTNHLDIPSQEILQEVLEEYAGTVVFVSHDRYLIQALATDIWAIEGRYVKVLPGRWEKYLKYRQDMARRAKAAASDQRRRDKAAKDDPRKDARRQTNRLQRQQRRLAELEKEIQAKDAELGELTLQISHAGSSGDVESVTRLGNQYQQAEKQLRRLWDEWTRLSEEMEKGG